MVVIALSTQVLNLSYTQKFASLSLQIHTKIPRLQVNPRESNMENHPFFTLSQVAQHNSKIDCWLVVDGRVLNVTKFMEEHPGGEEVLIEWAGKDATNQFKDIGHSKAARDILLNYQVGVLRGFTFEEADVKDASVREFSNSKQNEMSAFVVKEDGMAKYAAFAEFFMPLLLAVSYFSYRYLTIVVD